MSSQMLDLSESERIDENARQKLLANQAVNHQNAEVHVHTAELRDHFGRRTVQIVVYLPSEA